MEVGQMAVLHVYQGNTIICIVAWRVNFSECLYVCFPICAATGLPGFGSTRFQAAWKASN